MADHDELITSFAELTGAPANLATEYLTASDWNLERACASYFADADEAEADPSPGGPQPSYAGPRTLDGRPAPQYARASASTAKKPQKRTGLATLSSLGGGSGHGHGHSHDDDDDDEEDDSEDERRGPRDLFAGGEKSGLAVQDPSQRSSDPRRLINDIVAKAKSNAKKLSDEESSSAGPSRYFMRGGNILGGDGVESRPIDVLEPTTEPAAPNEPVQERILHIWEDGFSIDDGALRRFDDPQNQADLQMIRQGRAPLHLMNVRFDQRVDVKLQQHNEKFRQLPKIYRPFGGEGRRLGSPVPGVGGVAPAPAPPATTSAQASAGVGPTATTGADTTQPTLMLRIQLPDGTRLPARFNPSQTVGDVYDFVQRASAAVSGRAWVLSTTFPNKDHTDKTLVLGEMNEFKRGGTAVAKWA